MGRTCGWDVVLGERVEKAFCPSEAARDLDDEEDGTFRINSHFYK